MVLFIVIPTIIFSKGVSDDFNKPKAISKLLIACRDGDEKTVKLLLPKLTPEQINMKDRKGRTPLWMACLYRHKDIAELLLPKLTPEQINTPDECGQTPFYAACWLGNPETVKLLLLSQVLTASVFCWIGKTRCKGT